MMSYRLGRTHVDQRGVFETMHNPRGDVAGHIRTLGREVTKLASTYAGHRTGALKASISMSEDNTQPTGFAVQVGSQLDYALMHLTGTRAHFITTKHPGGELSFAGKSGKVYTRFVHHPGTKPNPYLLKALEEVVR